MKTVIGTYKLVCSVLLLTIWLFVQMGPGCCADDLSITLNEHVFSFSSIWQPFPSTAVTASCHVLRSGSARYRAVNDEHLQLEEGVIIMRGGAKPMFVSLKFAGDKLMIRVAPGAVALIDAAAQPLIATLNKRCCGAVLLYVPGARKTDSTRVNVEPGQAVTLEENPENTELSKDTDVRTLKTGHGSVALRWRHFDLGGVMQLLSEKGSDK